ncbi:MAG: alpha/beta hydrolase [Anaerolineae bacterium]|nr:alpha/beta hydrolase [Anaerolineae bacterium]
MAIPTLDGVTAKTIPSARITTRVLFTGPDNGVPVLFIHGNASNATYWEATMLALPVATQGSRGFRGIALDQRGYGEADLAVKIDATRGMGDFADDAVALLDALGIERAHVVGHSLGGAVIWRLIMDYAPRLISTTLVNPGAPFGFGGTKDLAGTPCNPDCAGSGGGVVNPEFARLMGEGYRGTEDPQASPRVVMNSFYWKPPFVPEREEAYLSGLLAQHVGPQDYPGDSVPSDNWPNVAPGVFGPINACSPKYLKPIKYLYAADPKPPVLWVRGSDDQIVSDSSFFDLGTLGSLGFVPGWPGLEAYPPQPMVGQTRAVLEQYAAAGGSFEEVIIEETGHSPYIERPAVFNAVFHKFLAE